MNIFFKATCFFVFLGLIIPSIGKAQVVQNDLVFGAVPLGPLGTYEVGLSQTTSFLFGNAQGLFQYNITELPNSQFEFSHLGIAEANALYQVTPGQVVSSVFANSTIPFAANDGTVGTLNLQVGQSVFLGYYDDTGGDFNGADVPSPTDNYGWFELSRTADGLEILGGATAIGRGIIVGTTTAVPEPASATLVLGMLTATMLRRRR